MKSIKLCLTCVVLCGLILPFLAQATPFTFYIHGDPVYVINSDDYGTNIAVLVGEKGVLLIDPMPGETHLNELSNLIQSLSTLPVKYVINTHDHQDHNGGNVYFRTQGAKVVEFDKVEDAQPVNILHQELKTEFGLQPINVRSHSMNDTLYFHPKSNILLVGDVFDNNWHPTFFAGGLPGFSKAIDIILSVGDEHTLIVPGHGLPTNKKAVKAFYQNTLDWLSKIKALHQANITVENMMQDSEVKQLLQRFNTTKRTPFIPAKAFKRFIQRSIAVINEQPNN